MGNNKYSLAYIDIATIILHQIIFCRIIKVYSKNISGTFVGVHPVGQPSLNFFLFPYSFLIYFWCPIIFVTPCVLGINLFYSSVTYINFLLYHTTSRVLFAWLFIDHYIIAIHIMTTSSLLVMGFNCVVKIQINRHHIKTTARSNTFIICRFFRPIRIVQPIFLY